ncbi:MAG: MucR family transcriptional regulator [Alphaproteobacteria bacterium]|nr:MucR family transcriptional regulator [Alphaproteobacteria bacterium]
MSEETLVSNVPNSLHLACDVVAAYVRHNTMPAGDVPSALREIHCALESLTRPAARPSRPTPAVPIKRSVARDYITCLEDGRKMKVLKRYIRAKYGMTPDEYRAKWNLPTSYPMVAPAYAQQRSAFAKDMGLGRKPRARKRRK